MRRFGLPDVDWIEPPNGITAPDQPDELAVLNDPVLQEWACFRCKSLADYADRPFRLRQKPQPQRLRPDEHQGRL